MSGRSSVAIQTPRKKCAHNFQPVNSLFRWKSGLTGESLHGVCKYRWLAKKKTKKQFILYGAGVFEILFCTHD